MDFGVTQLGGVLNAYVGQMQSVPQGRNLRLVARIEQPSYLMIAVTRESGLTDLRQIREGKMPVRILGGDAAIQQYVILQNLDEDWAENLYNLIYP